MIPMTVIGMAMMTKTMMRKVMMILMTMMIEKITMLSMTRERMVLMTPAIVMTMGMGMGMIRKPMIVVLKKIAIKLGKLGPRRLLTIVELGIVKVLLPKKKKTI